MVLRFLVEGVEQFNFDHLLLWNFTDLLKCSSKFMSACGYCMSHKIP